MGQFVKAGDPESMVFDPTDTIPAGALLRWNAGTLKVTTLAAEANFANFVGVSEFQVPPSSPIDTTSQGGPAGLLNRGLVRRLGIFNFKTTVGETYTHGVALKRGADDLTIALDGGAGHVIGFVHLPDGSTVVGAAGLNILVEIKSNFGSPTILSA